MRLGGKPRQAKLPPKKQVATSYYRGVEQPSPSPFKSKPTQKGWRTRLVKSVDLLLLVVILVCLVYSLVVSANPKVVLTSSDYHSPSIYRTAAAQAMNGFKDRNKLTFDEPAVASKLQAQFPEISKVSVELPLIGQQPVIRLNIANPEFLFNSNGQQYVLTANGIVVPNSFNPRITKTLVTINDLSGFHAQPGKAVLSAQQVAFISTVASQIQAAKVPIKSFNLPPAAQEVDLYTKDQNYYTKFYLGGNALVETGQYLAARHQLSAQNQNPSQYLDVRVEGKIFYK